MCSLITQFLTERNQAMKLRKTLTLSILAATMGLLSLSVSAQQTTRHTMIINGEVFTRPADATTGTARAIVGITIPTVDPNTCTSTNNNCVNARNPSPPSPGASGSQCGWVGVYQGNIGSRVSCEGKVLGLGRVPNCPAGSQPSAYNYVGSCETVVPPVNCQPEEPCLSTTYQVRPLSVAIGPVSRDTHVTSWNCPATYTFTSMITSGGSNGSDYFFSCIKN